MKAAIRTRLAKRSGEQRIGTHQVSRLTGATLRQLQYWDESGVIKPVRDGHARLYRDDQVKLADLLVRFRRLKISPTRARRMMSIGSSLGYSADAIISALTMLEECGFNPNKGKL